MKKKLKRLIATTFLLCLMVYLLLTYSSARFGFSRYTEISSASISQAERSGYCWISAEEFLAFDSNGQPFTYNIVKASKRPATEIEEQLRAGGVEMVSYFTFHKNWLLAYSPKTNRAYVRCLIKVGDSVVRTDIFSTPVSECFWMPNEIAWIEESTLSSAPTSLWRVGSTNVDRVRELGGDHIIGFVKDNVLLRSTNDVLVSPKGRAYFSAEMEIQCIRIDQNAPTTRLKTVSLERQEIAYARTSPSGDRIIWLCYSKSKLPHLTFLQKFPFINFEPRYTTSLYLSDSQAEHFSTLGSMSGSQSINVKWPDDNSVSFIYDGKMYLVPLN